MEVWHALADIVTLWRTGFRHYAIARDRDGRLSGFLKL